MRAFARCLRGGGWIHAEARVHSSATIQCNAVVHSGAVVGEGVVVGSASVVGEHVFIDQHTQIRWVLRSILSDSANSFLRLLFCNSHGVVLQNCSIGQECTIHPGVCIGQDGFGFTFNEEMEVITKPQELQVEIGKNVVVGANSCIDRGSWRNTVIGDNTKMDNMVQVNIMVRNIKPSK